jgi:hypothetical protein
VQLDSEALLGGDELGERAVGSGDGLLGDAEVGLGRDVCRLDRCVLGRVDRHLGQFRSQPLVADLRGRLLSGSRWALHGRRLDLGMCGAHRDRARQERGRDRSEEEGTEVHESVDHQ